MGLGSLNGKRFKYKSKYNHKNLPNEWVGKVKRTTVTHECNLDGTYCIKINVVSEQNCSYELDELIFLD